MCAPTYPISIDLMKHATTARAALVPIAHVGKVGVQLSASMLIYLHFVALQPDDFFAAEFLVFSCCSPSSRRVLVR